MSKRKTDAWMPIYVGDYLKDTTHLTAAEHGAYLLMILAYWNAGGPILAQESHLMRVTRMTRYEWRKSRATLLAFFESEGDRLRHDRIDQELKNAAARYESRAKGARSANDKRRAALAVRDANNGQIPDAERPAERTQSPRTEDQGSIKELSKQVVRTLSLNKNQKAQTPDEVKAAKKAAWQGKIFAWAQHRLAEADYTAFMIAWANEEPWAVAKAEQFNVEMRAAA
ncbi:MAG: DUF1376 domain-containing protein [Rhodospirillaceae bacterium]|nr:DUF1376 domain-containing protein [Rhodospirillaceae bacterium]